MTPNPLIKRALISVSDKSGLVSLAQCLTELDVEILSTGGSARTLRDAGIPVTEVSDHTGFPEIMDGRVKTLHPTIHGGLLARRDLPEHQAAMAAHGIAPIDLLVVNLYPFEATLASGADFSTCVENIDIGGPAMVRAAAKNHEFVAVVTDPADYEAVVAALKDNKGSLPGELRRHLATAAYAHTAAYDTAISSWLQGVNGETFPRQKSLSGRLSATLRYGENPHQTAAVYRTPNTRPGVASAEQIQGKALSYNNLNDTNAAFELVCEFEAPTVAIIKHANPCGVASATTLAEAYRRALACDPVSAFGGIVALNGPLDKEVACEIVKLFAEVIIAPDIEDGARAVLTAKSNLRVLQTGALADPSEKAQVIAPLAGGFLLQDRDNGRINAADLKVVTKRPPTEQEEADMLFAFRVAKHVKSNAIVYVKNQATVGIGAGQMSRVDSSRIAAQKARDAAKAAGEEEPRTHGSVVASDAFFPFADGLMAAVEAGATAVIQPGGSIRDEEVIAAADGANLAMVYTGMRHFRH
ncbi:MAG: bifunctional phosphoribosylaminoimidazolecarboxamide formyltransferase/IMP cyclohydrolase [Pseudomonadota bacterium]